MNDVAQGALIGGGLTFLTALAGQAFNFWNAREERNDRYRGMLYEKELSVYQTAFMWMARLWDPIERARELCKPDGALPDGFLIYLTTTYQEAREWWDSNCLYLDDLARERTLDVIELVGAYVRSDRMPPSQDDQYQMRKGAMRAIEEGMGKSHLPKAEVGRSRAVA
jgi:hypothetical protein